MTNTKPRWLNRKTVADLLDIHVNTLDRWLKDDRMRARLGAKKMGHHWRFLSEHVELFMRSMTY